MILKLDQWIANAIGKEARISHFDVKVYGGPSDKIKGSVREEIRAQYSEKYLADADYILFFKGGSVSDEDAVEKLAPIVQRALGKASANDLTASDFKAIEGEAAPEADDAEGEEKAEAKKTVKYLFVKVTIA